MTEKQQRLLLIYFLKRHKALIPFLLNLYLIKNTTLNSYIHKIKHHYELRSIIPLSFLFNLTTEKSGYWYDISDKWKEELDEFASLVKEQRAILPSKSTKKICDDLLNSDLYRID